MNKKLSKAKKTKKKYSKPLLKKGSIMTVGALCNGMNVGGRKLTAGSPDFCSASKLLS